MLFLSSSSSGSSANQVKVLTLAEQYFWNKHLFCSHKEIMLLACHISNKHLHVNGKFTCQNFCDSHLEYSHCSNYAICFNLIGDHWIHLYVAGRIDIQLNVDIPVDTELVEPLQDGCIWHQARGAATEVSAVEDAAGSSEKVLSLSTLQYFIFWNFFLVLHKLVSHTPIMPVA